MAEVEIDYLEETGGPGITELPSEVDAPPAQTRLGVEGGDLAAYPGWELEHVEQFLKGTGAGIHILLGQGERDWLMTKADLERMAPPLTRIANRWEPALRLSPLADPFLFTYGAVLYVWRNALIMQRAKKDKQAADAVEPDARYEYAGEEDDVGGEDELPDVDDGGPRPYFPDSPRAARSI